METCIYDECLQTYGACADIRDLKIATQDSEIIAKKKNKKKNKKKRKNDAKLCLTYFSVIKYVGLADKSLVHSM